jgi:hypothetical protein
MELHDLPLAGGELLEGHMKQLGALTELDGHVIRLGCRLRIDLEGGHLAAFRAPPVLADEVHRDRHDPGAQLRALPEIVSRAVKPEERLLDDFLCEFVIAKVASGVT